MLLLGHLLLEVPFGDLRFCSAALMLSNHGHALLCLRECSPRHGAALEHHAPGTLTEEDGR